MKSAQREPSPYRFDHFRTALLLKDMRFSRGSAQPGDVLPDHRLTYIDGTEVRLSELTGDRPLVLVTGSTTCPVTAASLPRLQQLEERFRGELASAFVYVREAHPGASIPQAATLAEKREYARLLRDLNGVSWPVLVDDLDGPLHRALDMQPNSLHVVGAGGRILFRALFADDPATPEALAAIARGRSPARGTGSATLRPALRSAGHVHRVLVSAGAGAYADVARAALPMALLGFVGHLLSRLRRARSHVTHDVPDRRCPPARRAAAEARG